MQSQLLEEIDTMQNYLQTLFDSLPKINAHSSSLIVDNDLLLILQQNLLYGRKIIQLSDKFTAKYRKDHFIDRKDIEQKIVQIFQYVCPDVRCSNLDEMINSIFQKVQLKYHRYFSNDNNLIGMQSRSSYNQNHPLHLSTFKPRSNQMALKDPNIQQVKFQFKNEQIKEPISQSIRKSGINKQLSNGSNKFAQNIPFQLVECTNGQIKQKKSVTRSKISQNANAKQQFGMFNTKNVLQIKAYFQQQQLCVRKIFDKLNKIVSSSSSGKKEVKISEENSKYTKLVSEIEQDNIKDFVHANIENNKYNINKVSNFIDVLQQHYAKKTKIQLITQGKFSTYIQEISKRQQIYLFAVSKLLQNLNDLRQHLKNATNASSEQIKGEFQQLKGGSLQMLSNLQQYCQKLYDLYPSHTVLKDLKIQVDQSSISYSYNTKQMQTIGYKNQGVQVSITMGAGEKIQKSAHRQSLESRRSVLELYKTTTRITETVERFQRSFKFKKTIQNKQVERFLQQIRDCLSIKNSSNTCSAMPIQIVNYQEELRKLLQKNSKNQNQMAQQFNKKCKKSQKQVQQLQKALQQAAQQHKQELEKINCQHKKLLKKLEIEKQQNKKNAQAKIQMQKCVEQTTRQVARLQKQVEDQTQKFDKAEQILLAQNKKLQSQVYNLLQLNKNTKQEYKAYEKTAQQEREIYHQKIIFLQAQQQNKNEQFLQIKLQLQEMVKQNSILKKQIQQLTELYEQKIKQLEQLIDNIKQLEVELKSKGLELRQYQQNKVILQQKIIIYEKDKTRTIRENSRLEEKLKQKQNQASKFRQLGVLNQSDIQVLRQEMNKVKEAYIQSEQQLESLRNYVYQLESDKEFVTRQNKNYQKQVNGYNQKYQSYMLDRQKLQKQVTQISDELKTKKKQHLNLTYEFEQIKKESARLKREISQTKQSNIKIEAELRSTRQQLHKKTQLESIQSGKRKLQIQTMKVQLRKKHEQIQKMKEVYQQRIQVLESKNKQLNQFITHKQLLSKISNNHASQ